MRRERGAILSQNKRCVRNTNNPTSSGTPPSQELIGNIAGVDALIEQTLTVTKEVIEMARDKRLYHA